MPSSSNAVNGLSVDELLILFSANSSSSSSSSTLPATSSYAGSSRAPSVSITYSVSPAGISRLVVNHNLDQGKPWQEAAFDASVSLDAMNAVAHGSGSDTQSWNAAALATTSDGAHDTLMNIAGVELYL
jgi:hypothetical protein